MSEIRKLAAILVADVVGYSRLAGADEERTLARLRSLRGDLIDPAIAAHCGRIVKGTGDGALVEFRSVVDAVRCAIEVQTGMVERNAGVLPNKRIEFRIGAHLGDVVEENDGDLMGDGVNIAARLEGVAKPGTVCLSEDAYRQVKSRLEMKVSDLGPIQLKNIAEPMRAYLVEDKPAKRRSEPRHGLVATLDALAILGVASAGLWYLIAGMPSIIAGWSATSTAASSEPTVATLPPTTAGPSATPTASSSEPTVAIVAATGAPAIAPSLTETQRQAKPVFSNPRDADTAGRRVARPSAKRQLTKEPAPSANVESASNTAQPCVLSVAEINGNHPSCEYLHGLPPRAEPARSTPAQYASAKSALESPQPCTLSVAEMNGNHPSCEYLHSLPTSAGAGTVSQ